MYSGCSYLKIRQYDSMATMSTHVCDVCVCVSVCIHIYATDYCTSQLSVIFVFMCVYVYTHSHTCVINICMHRNKLLECLA